MRKIGLQTQIRVGTERTRSINNGNCYLGDIPEYPTIALREVLINALAHSDYSLLGSRIQIAIFNNRIEVQSPGMLPFGFTLEDLKAGVSRIRNRVIARVFSELNLMEEWGSGYRRILQACHKEGYPEPEWLELGSATRVTFYPHERTKLNRSDGAMLKESSLSPKQEEILHLLREGKPLAFRDILRDLSNPISERTLHYDLAQLKEMGLLISRGKGRGIIWQREKRPAKLV